jgi:hypothetical protein
VLTDEPAGLGASTGQTGVAGTITAFNAGQSTVAGLTGMTASSVGNFLTVSGATSPGNNGTFLIVAYVSATSVVISNAAGVSPETGLTWTERRAYCLNDDLDFERTDRAAIKGVAYSATVPPYERPTAIGTPVPTNLANISGKTTDARGFIFNRQFVGATVAATNTVITLTSVGNLEHADAVDKTGIPCFDAAPYINDYLACYVRITNPADGTELKVLAGAHAGEKIYGLTLNGTSTSPDSVQVKFYSVPLSGNLSTQSTAYTWEAGLPTTLNLVYGYFERLDQASEYILRTLETLGVEESGALRQDVTDIQQVIGMDDGDTFLDSLTNTGNYFPFVNLPDATPSVTEALNTLNAQIGSRDYNGPLLTDGQTITASLQALSDSIANANVVRYIERLSADLLPNTAHTLPGAATYVLDGTNNGRGLSVYTRGILRDPGTVINGDDYVETSVTQVTFYAKQKLGDHINYYVYG